MEEPQDIVQQPQDKVQDKTIPHIETNFGDDAFDSAPIKRGHFGGFNEWMFSLMRPKKKVAQSSRTTILKGPSKPTMRPEAGTKALPDFDTPKGYEIKNGILLHKKTLAERVRDQLRYPIIKSSVSLVNGISLAVFAVGAYLLYSALPTRPDLVIGIILVSLAGNVIMNNR
jgi:hypothetical protein